VREMGFSRILIVDDSATSRMIIRRCFEIAGFRQAQFFEAEDGVVAISFLKTNKVDLVLSDLRMPKMDGTTFIRKLKMSEETRAIPVVVISSMSNDLLEAELLKSGVKAVIRKPISPAKVAEAVGGAA
jgi:two-component system chemotaxis response regulator CheY